jgi:hypothetical protein
MKKIKLTIIFISIILTLNCSVPFDSLKVLRWGPVETKLGSIPNLQPDGKMGIWVDVTPTEDLGEMQVIFDGKPVPTSVEPKLITAGISQEYISSKGEKRIEIKSIETGKILFVGNFKVIE